MRGLFMQKKNIEVKKMTGLSYIAIKKCLPTYKLPFFFKKSFKMLQKVLPEISEENIHFARYSNIDWDTVECEKGFIGFFKSMFKKFYAEVCISVEEKPANLGSEVNFLQFETFSKTLQTIHVGPYHKVADTYNELIDYANKNNLTLDNETFEIYLNDPRLVKAEEIETLIIIPLK